VLSASRFLRLRYAATLHPAAPAPGTYPHKEKERGALFRDPPEECASRGSISA